MFLNNEKLMNFEEFEQLEDKQTIFEDDTFNPFSEEKVFIRYLKTKDKLYILFRSYPFHFRINQEIKHYAYGPFENQSQAMEFMISSCIEVLGEAIFGINPRGIHERH